jgi:putative ABC transport system ATP-binding protein
MDKKVIIELSDISKTYANGEIRTTVLQDVQLSINEGEFAAITGPSGSGKSTLMSIIGLLDSASTGRYILDGKDVSKLSEDELAEIRASRIGFVFQSFNLLPRATVLKNVQLPLVYANIPKATRLKMAIKALEMSKMENARYSNLSNQLSGGQMQRVAIARALINDPAIILADEPTGNLDQKTGLAVLDTFKDLNKIGKTIIIITHDHSIASHAKRIIELRDGKIINDYLTNHKNDRGLR